MNSKVTEKLKLKADSHGIKLTVKSIASFSDVDGVSPGEGIDDLVRSSINPAVNVNNVFWPDEVCKNDRAYMSFKNSTVQA